MEHHIFIRSIHRMAMSLPIPHIGIKLNAPAHRPGTIDRNRCCLKIGPGLPIPFAKLNNFYRIARKSAKRAAKFPRKPARLELDLGNRTFGDNIRTLPHGENRVLQPCGIPVGRGHLRWSYPATRHRVDEDFKETHSCSMQPEARLSVDPAACQKLPVFLETQLLFFHNTAPDTFRYQPPPVGNA